MYLRVRMITCFFGSPAMSNVKRIDLLTMTADCNGFSVVFSHTAMAHSRNELWAVRV